MALSKTHKCPDKKTAGKISERQSIKHTHKKKPSKKSEYHYYDQYRDLFTMKMKPVPESFIDKISQELIEWAKNDPSALILRDFFYDKGIRISTAQKWAKKHTILKESVEDAKFLIGSRREKGAIKREYDPAMIKPVMINYDPEWKKSEEWRSKLKQEADQKTQQANIQWILPKFPDSKLVPEKPKDKNG